MQLQLTVGALLLGLTELSERVQPLLILFAVVGGIHRNCHRSFVTWRSHQLIETEGNPTVALKELDLSVEFDVVVRHFLDLHFLYLLAGLGLGQFLKVAGTGQKRRGEYLLEG